MKGPDTAGKFPWVGVILIRPVVVSASRPGGQGNAPALIDHVGARIVGGVAKLLVENSILTVLRPGLM